MCFAICDYNVVSIQTQLTIENKLLKKMGNTSCNSGAASKMNYPKSFHPTDAVLACGSQNGQVMILKAANSSVAFSNWRIEAEFKTKFLKDIVALEWNVNYLVFVSLMFFNSL